MDNSFITRTIANEGERPHDLLTNTEEREAKLVKMIEALGQVAVSDDWRVLKELIFDDLVNNLERRIVNEARANEINLPELYKLQGQLSWAKKYANLEELNNTFKVELKNIRKQNNG